MRRETDVAIVKFCDETYRKYLIMRIQRIQRIYTELCRGILLFIALLIFVSCGQQSNEITFQTFTTENFEKHPKGKAEKDGFSYKINFLYPAKFEDKAVLEILQTQFIRHTLGEKFASMMSGDKPATLKETVDAYIDVWRQAYYDDIKEMQELNSDPDIITGWHIECGNSILFRNETLLQLHTKDGLYPYAAHVWESASCHLFNLQTGDEYRRDDIFRPEAAESVIRLIIPALLAYWNVRTIREVMIDRNKIWTPETNFAVTDEGIYIMYNDNELTDDMPGMPSLTIPYAQIMPCLREGTPVWDIATSHVGADPQQATTVEPLLDSNALNEALLKAIQTDDQSAFDRLIRQVQDIDRMIPYPDEGYDEKSYSLLGLACAYKRCEIAEKILHLGADISIGKGDDYIVNDALFVAVECENVCAIMLLLNSGADPNRMNNENGLTVLSVSCMYGGNYEIAKLLVENGANVNGLGDTGFDYIIYPLIEAVQSDNIALVQLLIDNGCTLDIMDNEGYTPLKIAENNNNLQMLELLKKHIETIK